MQDFKFGLQRSDVYRGIISIQAHTQEEADVLLEAIMSEIDMDKLYEECLYDWERLPIQTDAHRNFRYEEACEMARSQGVSDHEKAGYAKLCEIKRFADSILRENEDGLNGKSVEDIIASYEAPPPPEAPESFKKTDWKELKEQYGILAEIGSQVTGEQQDAVQGLLNFLEFIRDEASAIYGLHNEFFTQSD